MYALRHALCRQLRPSAVLPALSPTTPCSPCTTIARRTMSDLFFLDGFAKRQWQPDYQGTRITFDQEEFTRRINAACGSEEQLVEGYAPFCKHVFVPNFVKARVPVLLITAANEALLRSGYQARTETELPVLNRWFPLAAVETHEAKMLDIILYSRAQIIEERRAMADGTVVPDQPWGIISIKAQDEAFETPMQPITMMRNALGKEEGGSGVPLDRKKYLESVAYWKDRAPVV